MIVSLAITAPDELSRHAYLLYSNSRFSIAISRTWALALVLVSLKLLELDAKSVKQLRPVDTLACLNTEEGERM